MIPCLILLCPTHTSTEYCGHATWMATTLQPETQASVCSKYLSIFSIRNRTDEGAVADLQQLFHSTSSVLLRHEIAYALGQMQRKDAVPFLSEVLCDSNENAITRHEAAEALGAIGEPESIELLRKYASDPAQEVADTCSLAVARLEAQVFQDKGVCGCERRPQELLRLEQSQLSQQSSNQASELQSEGQSTLQLNASSASVTCTSEPTGAVTEHEAGSNNLFVTVDPAPAARAAPLAELRARLLDRGLPLFERYRAMFALRDAVPKTGEPAVAALCEGFADDCALFKHEVAFVLGQLEHPASVPSLCAAMESDAEHPMVRHEAAEVRATLRATARHAPHGKYRLPRPPLHIGCHITHVSCHPTPWCAC